MYKFSIYFICLFTSALNVSGFFQPIFIDRCTTSAVVQVSWVWCHGPGADTIPRIRKPLPKLYACPRDREAVPKVHHSLPSRTTVTNERCHTSISIIFMGTLLKSNQYGDLSTLVFDTL
jgi:hypothetical protein